jgi:urocanate hydratase
VVYGKRPRGWELQRDRRSLRNLNDDETLLIQSGKPVGVFRTEYSPGVIPIQTWCHLSPGSFAPERWD